MGTQVTRLKDVVAFKQGIIIVLNMHDYACIIQSTYICIRGLSLAGVMISLACPGVWVCPLSWTP